MIYVSYFGNRKLWDIPDEYKICIANKNVSDNIKVCTEGLIPDSELVKDYKYRSLSEEKYVERYYEENLSKLNAEELYKKYDNKILLCFCSGFCHRDIIKYWFNQQGFECKSFDKDDDLDNLISDLNIKL